MAKARETISFVLILFLVSSSQNHVVQSFTINATPRSLNNEISIQAHLHTSRNSCPRSYTYHNQRVPVLYQSINTREAPPTVEDLKKGEKKENDEAISDLDARVLQSLLDDESLDLKSEENLKKMLENKEKNNSNNRNTRKRVVNDSDSEFSSSFFKTVSDNAIWNSLRAKADSILESTKMFVQNKIERDVELLAALSLFAWDRALKDVGRALPSAGKSGARVVETVRKTVFSLATNSSFVEKGINGSGQRGPFLLSSMSQYSDTNDAIDGEKTIYDELTTPQDEIQKVSESIKDILSGKSTSSERGLRSVAPSGTSRSGERQRMAFERKKETVLQREKEGIDKKAMRAASSVTDAAWEIKREMEIEGNEAGYRSEETVKRLEASIASSALLEGGRNWINKQLQAEKNLTPQLESSANFDGMDVGEMVESKSSSTSDENFIEVDVLGYETQSDAVSTEEDYDLNNLVGGITEADLDAERNRLVSVLTLCLEEPDQTWLQPDLLPVENKQPFFLSPAAYTESSFNMSEDDEAWEKIITEMVSIKNDLEIASSLTKTLNKDEMINELYEMNRLVEKITNGVAETAGKDSAEYLRAALLGEDSLSQDDKLDSQIDYNEINGDINDDTKDQKVISDLQNEVPVTAEIVPEIISESIDELANGSGPTLAEEIEDMDGKVDTVAYEYQTVVIADIISSVEEFATRPSPAAEVKPMEILTDVDFQLNTPKVDIQNGQNQFLDDEVEVYAAEVEVVTNYDDEFIEEEKRMNSAAVEEESPGIEKKDNVVVIFALRTLDVTFFVVEKFFTIGVPGIVNSATLIKENTDAVNRNGLGKKGWDTLENVNNAQNRY